MPRRPTAPRDKAADAPRRVARTPKQPVRPPSSVPFASERNDQLVKLGDLCAAAHRIAEEQGEKLLAYLLSMAIQEGQSALRREIAARAGVSEDPAGKGSSR